MALILIYGISTAGKSSVAQELVRRGQKAVDLEHLPASGWYNKKTDTYAAGFGQTNDKDNIWLSQHEWRVSLNDIARLREQARNSDIFICGGAANINDILNLCDKSIWLKTDESTIRQRAGNKRDHTFGTQPHELSRILSSNLIQETQAVSRGSIIIDACQPLDKVVDNVLLSCKEAR